MTDAEAGLSNNVRRVGEPRRFRPDLDLGHHEALAVVARAVDETAGLSNRPVDDAIDVADRRRVLLRRAGVDEQGLSPSARFATALRVLRDLLAQGWVLDRDDEGVVLMPPGSSEVPSEPEDEKTALRQSFSFARAAQLAEPSVGRFIRDMERRGIGRLFADGAALADRLGAGGTIDPEIEVIEPGAKDPVTRLLLQDVWRYARLYWSIPYKSTPGRNVFVLIRDRAGANRPLIGIAALGNPVLGLNARDSYFGWTSESLEKRAAGVAPAWRRAAYERLRVILAEAVAEVYRADLPAPDQALASYITELEELARASEAERREASPRDGTRSSEYSLIRRAHEQSEAGRPNEVDWVSVARTALYRRKRAAILADLLRAESALEGVSEAEDPLGTALSTADGRRAVEAALRRQKQIQLSGSVMELTTCGAVAPYRDLLGGKLVAALMTSREIANVVESRYANHVSLIASAMAGRAISRPARLFAVTTASLYSVGSSQYNRLKFHIGGKSLGYERVGQTDSFGTVHFAPDTVEGLTEIGRQAKDNRRTINHLFGEGASPKLRQLRAGLEALGLPPSVFLRHHSPRILYAAPLCANFRDVALGLSSDPDYILAAAGSTEQLAEYWRVRWLLGRIAREGILDRVRAEAFDAFRLSNELGDAPTERGVQSDAVQLTLGEASVFVERLYRGANSYADRMSEDELSLIHVDLGVESYLEEQIREQKQVVVTGNPGDGKTHLIERMRAELERAGADVITDANSETDAEILSRWQRAVATSRPFVLAINEWPLFVLEREARQVGFPNVTEALRQVTSSRFYADEPTPGEGQFGVVVVDLGLRNLLISSVIRMVVARLTQDRFYSGLPREDPAMRNREALRTEMILGRMCQLLELTGRRVGRVPMRQLVGYLSFVLTAGRSVVERLNDGQDGTRLAYYQLAFEGGTGLLFDAVRRAFDPALVAHPGWDERLWSGDTQPGDWVDGVAPAPVLGLPEHQRLEGFRAAKRRFFFEHRSGYQLLELIAPDDQEFDRLLSEANPDSIDVVRRMVLGINRFYEPQTPESARNELLLWQSHRYDVRAPQAFVRTETVASDRLHVRPLQYASWVKQWLPDEQRERRTFALIYDGGPATLEVDRDLYLTMSEAHRGLGQASWSRSATRRITRFVDALVRLGGRTNQIEDVTVRNTASDLDERFEVQRNPALYRL